jgi:hypothetical protein
MVDGLLSDSDLSRSGTNTESKLDALIARIHNLGSGKNASTASEKRPSPPADRVSNTDSTPARTLDTPGSPSRGTSVPPRTVPRPAGSASQGRDFLPSRDEPWRPEEPQSLDDAGITGSMLEGLILRFLLSIGEAEGRKIANQVKLPFRLVVKALEEIKAEHRVTLKAGTETNDYVYALTESGRRSAQSTTLECTYYGACPVNYDDYIASVRKQSIEGQSPNREDLKRSFADLLIDPNLFAKLGPAISSGRGMFLFGYPGNGKTSIAERVTSAFGRYTWIPSAVEIDGAIMRVFDPMIHEIAQPEQPDQGGGLLDLSLFDKRWVRIKRPTIVVGGELTMDMLEVQRNEKTHINEAPLQMKSNCGTLVIDDFGRQKMSIDKLLNRWIIPLEKRYDFLNMPGGKKVQVPFDQLVVFSTNLEPKDLVDDAFLRRIPYKIEVTNPSEENFRKLFEIMCRVLKIPYNQQAVDYLIENHYRPINRPFRNCQPRDLLLQIKSFCQYNELPIEMKNEYVDFAVDNYFSIM